MTLLGGNRENKLFHLENDEKKIVCDSRLKALFRRKIVSRNNIYTLLATHLAENLDHLEDEFGSSSKEQSRLLREVSEVIVDTVEVESAYENPIRKAMSSSGQGLKKRYIPNEVPIETSCKVQTKRMKVESSFREGSVPVSVNSQLNLTSELQTPPPTPHASQNSPVVTVGSSSLGTKQTTPAQDPHAHADDQEEEPEEKYLASLTNEWRRYVLPEEVEKAQMLSLEEAINIGLKHNFKAVCSALDLQKRIKSLQNEKKILIDQVDQTVEKNSKLQGQIDEEKALSARLREHIADLKATVTNATSRAEGAEARADAAEKANMELRRVNKELKDGITSWEDAAIKLLCSQKKSK